MTNMQPIPQVPGENDERDLNGVAPDPMGGDDGALLDPDVDQDGVDSAAADRAAATEGTRDSDTDR